MLALDRAEHRGQEPVLNCSGSAFQDNGAAIRRILRILVTSSCDYSCTYCHGEGMSPGALQEMGLEDFVFVAEAASPLLEGFAIAGGEPLLFPDLASLCLRIWTTTGRQVHLTTNGSKSLLPLVPAFGAIERLNLSINALDPMIYERISGVAMPERVLLANAELLSRSGIEVHTNTVLLPGLSTSVSAVREIVDFCTAHGFTAEFLHLIPRTPKEVGETCDGLEQFRASVHALGLRPSYCHRPFSHPNTLYTRGSTRLVLRDYGQLPVAEACGECGMHSYCSEGFCHIRLSPDGTMSACRAGVALRRNVLASAKERNSEVVRETLSALQDMFPLHPEWAQLCLTPRQRGTEGGDWRFWR